MKRVLRAIWTIGSSRALPPLVLGFFLVVYIGIAFFTDETLIMLMAITRKSFFLTAVLALLPLNSMCRIVVEAGNYLKRRRALSDAAYAVPPALYDETVDLSTPPAFTEMERRLGAAGYTTKRSGTLLAAWRGLDLSPARIIYLAGIFCLFAGILISLVSRTVNRQAVIEGAPFPTPLGNGGTVERITYGLSSGPILARDLIMEVADPSGRSGVEKFGVYPPARFRGAFVYPRYLGVALSCRLLAPDLPGGSEKFALLPIYPPGREASTELTGTPYRLTLSLAKPDDGTDPYTTGRLVFIFKLLKGTDVLVTGSVPSGGEFSRDGYVVAFPESRRIVITDFISDYGVLLIWSASILFVIAASVWIPVLIFFPRREMLFRSEEGLVRACSRAEGAERKHAGVFHEALDLLEMKKHEMR